MFSSSQYGIVTTCSQKNNIIYVILLLPVALPTGSITKKEKKPVASMTVMLYHIFTIGQKISEGYLQDMDQLETFTYH